MARVQFLRGDAYVAGDLIIQIYIDGKKAGSLMGGRPLELQLAPGTYTMQAQMFGMKGESLVLQIGDTDQRVAVHGTRARVVNSVWASTSYIMLAASPHKPLWLYILATIAVGVICIFELYRWRKLRPQLLRLQVSDRITSESRASSTRLSSPR